jgi:spore germination protein YaaH
VPITSAQEINFLHTPSSDCSKSSPLTQALLTRLRNIGLGKSLVTPSRELAGLYGHNGAFEFQLRPTMTSQSLIAGCFVSLLVVSLTLSGPVSALQVRAPKSLVLPSALPMLSEPVAIQSPASQSVSIEPELSQPKPAKAVGLPAAESQPSESAQPVVDQSGSRLKRDVFAFVPYWFIGKTGPIQYDKLSTIAYFGAEVTHDGMINETEPGYTTLFRPDAQSMFADARRHGVKVVMTYRVFNEEQINSIILNPANRDRAIANMIRVAKEQQMLGANIDFENHEHPTDVTRAAFSEFVQLATQRFHEQLPGSEVTVSTYAAAARWQKLYDVGQLAAVSDGLFVMAYDFYTVNSGTAGPVAPLHGYPHKYWYDVAVAVEDHLKVAPADKLILGVPYYGYDWPTVSNTPNSKVTHGRATTSTYRSSVEDPANHSGSRQWDEAAKVPFYTYQKDGVWRTTYYDDVQSLAQKYDLINQQNLKGVGIWALGQDGSRPELWQLLADKFIQS